MLWVDTQEKDEQISSNKSRSFHSCLQAFALAVHICCLEAKLTLSVWATALFSASRSYSNTYKRAFAETLSSSVFSSPLSPPLQLVILFYPVFRSHLSPSEIALLACNCLFPPLECNKLLKGRDQSCSLFSLYYLGQYLTSGKCPKDSCCLKEFMDGWMDEQTNLVTVSM